MYLHKIIFSEGEVVKHRGKFEDAYSLHQIVWDIISKDKNQKRNFLYRVEYDNFEKIKYLYLLATLKAQQKANLKIKISSKLQPQLQEGEALYFKLRANPVVKRKENGRHKEYSVVMDAKHQFKIQGDHYRKHYSLSDLIHKTGFDWLARKAKQHGFAVNPSEIKIDNDREFFVSPPNKKNYKLRTLDFEGKMVVTDTNMFINALFNGIGSAKAFGCGLLLVKRI